MAMQLRYLAPNDQRENIAQSVSIKTKEIQHVRDWHSIIKFYRVLAQTELICCKLKLLFRLTYDNRF